MNADYDVALSIPSSDSSLLTVHEDMACYVTVVALDIDRYKDNFISCKYLLTVSARNEIALSQMMMDNLIQNKEH